MGFNLLKCRHADLSLELSREHFFSPRLFAGSLLNEVYCSIKTDAWPAPGSKMRAFDMMITKARCTRYGAIKRRERVNFTNQMYVMFHGYSDHSDEQRKIRQNYFICIEIKIKLYGGFCMKFLFIPRY